MEVYIAIAVTFLVALSLLLKTKKAFTSFAIASLVMPAFVLYAEFWLPYQGDGASMWPIALFVGCTAGLVSAALGIGLGFLIYKVLKGKSA